MSSQANLELQVCGECGAVQYPAREICHACLGGELERSAVDGKGELLSWTRLHASLEPRLQDRLPLIVVSVGLAAGPVVLAYWHGDEPVIGQAVEVGIVQDDADAGLLAARPISKVGTDAPS